MIFSFETSMFLINFDAIALKTQMSWPCLFEILTVLACFITEKTKLKMFRLFRTFSKMYLSVDKNWKVDVTDCLNFLIKMLHHWSISFFNDRKTFFFKLLRFSIYQIWTHHDNIHIDQFAPHFRNRTTRSILNQKNLNRSIWNVLRKLISTKCFFCL